MFYKDYKAIIVSNIEYSIFALFKQESYRVCYVMFFFLDYLRACLNIHVKKNIKIIMLPFVVYASILVSTNASSSTAYVSLEPGITIDTMGSYVDFLKAKGRRFEWFDRDSGVSVSQIVEEMMSKDFKGIVFIFAIKQDEDQCIIPIYNGALNKDKIPWISLIPYNQESDVRSYFERLQQDPLPSKIKELYFVGKKLKWYSQLGLSDKNSDYVLAMHTSPDHNMETINQFESMKNWYLHYISIHERLIKNRKDQDIQLHADLLASYSGSMLVLGGTLAGGIVALLCARTLAHYAYVNPHADRTLLFWKIWTYGANGIINNDIYRLNGVMDHIVYLGFSILSVISIISSGLTYILPKSETLKSLYESFYSDYYGKMLCLPVIFGDASIIME